MARVGFFDLSSTSGAAFDAPDGQRPVLATYVGRVLVPGEFGPLFTGFRRWMIDLIVLHKPTHIGVEAPWIPSGNRKPSRFTAPDVMYMLISLAGIANQVADEAGLIFFKAEPSTIRKHFTGRGRWGSRTEAKRAVIRQCHMLGWRVRNDHEADAAAGWAWKKAELDPGFSYRTTPLFGRASA